MDDLHSPAHPACALPDWLRFGPAGTSGASIIVARNAYRLRAVTIDQPLLILPLQGMKRIRFGEQSMEIAAGRFLLIHEALSLEVENLPALDGKAYRAWIIPIPWRIVSMLRTLLGPQGSLEPRSTALVRVTVGSFAPLLEPLRRLLDAMQAAQADKRPVSAANPEVDLAILGLTLALVRGGHGHFLHASEPALAARIRLIAADDPARAWTSADFEERLHMSGATLRRRLAEEQTSLRKLLREVRLHHALALLQTGERPLKSIAFACGYRSVPSFTRNFTSHFGTVPGKVAGDGI